VEYRLNQWQSTHTSSIQENEKESPSMRER
jgi:hypothetical protein